MRIHTTKISVFTIITLCSFLFFASFSIPEIENKATSGGDLSFSVRTVTAGGNYAPKHVLAIWVEYDNGFVKTRKAMANNRIQYLYTWKAASNFNVVDAITGPTISLF